MGQPFSLLLKQNTIISELALYDRESTYGILADLSHIDTAAKVTGELILKMLVVGVYEKKQY